MSVRFVSRDVEWTDVMRECVHSRIVVPLRRHLNNSDFELSVHLEWNHKRPPTMEMWVVLQTFDGRGNEVVRMDGPDFSALTNEVSSRMREKLRRKASLRRRLLVNPLSFLPIKKGPSSKEPFSSHPGMN